jgi:hypothetical protein
VDEQRKLEKDMELLRKHAVSITYGEKRNRDEERELKRDVGLLKEKSASISSEER